MTIPTTVDITPTPRILRTLGDIPFEVWQCLAELADNSLDAFKAHSTPAARLEIAWSKESVPMRDREILIADNGPGMSIADLQNAARAGYSSNDPIHNLGLFGMGFNIATARLGEETTFLSAQPDSEMWTGIRINFSELIQKKTFDAPLVYEKKKTPDESGTRIYIRGLKDGVFADLKNKEAAIRRRLEIIYSAILSNGGIEIVLQGKGLRAARHCAWGAHRFVVHKGKKISAVQEIDQDLGEAWFDVSKNRYLGDIEVADGEPEGKPSNVVKRSRRLRGWLGIQRFSDTSEFGIDFIRNGRKILISDKSLFAFESPDTGASIIEYPVELGTTVGGRIIGELHVDYLIPTYQKNAFDTSDKSWRLTVEAVRGAGPMLPKRRAALGYPAENTSPLGLLVNAYRRPDPGTKNLALPRDVARAFLGEFRKGHQDYQSDDKWFKAAQEEDKAIGGESGATISGIDSGATATDDIDQYAYPAATSQKAKTESQAAKLSEASPKANSDKLLLAEKSVLVHLMSGKYTYSSLKPPFEVEARKVMGEQLRSDGRRVPCLVFQDGIKVDFFFDETHPLLEEYPISPKQLMLHAIAERFSVRDHPVNSLDVYLALVDNHLADERVNAATLKEKAEEIFDRIRDALPACLSKRTNECLDLIKQDSHQNMILAQALLADAPDLISVFQSGSGDSQAILLHLPDEIVISLIERMPEEFLDGKVFSIPYSSISLVDESHNQALRKRARDTVVSYLRDLHAIRLASKPSKPELIRYSNTLRVVSARLV